MKAQQIIAGLVSLALLSRTLAAATPTIPSAWVGRYQAKGVKATSGMDGDRVTTIGKGQGQTSLFVQTQACATDFTMEVDAYGNIEGHGRIMYVYQGAAANLLTMALPGAVANVPGGPAMTLKDGKQFRDWSFNGTVSPDGSVEINGVPNEYMDYLNVNRWEKHRPWSALPPTDKGHMRGPFRVTLTMQGKVPTISVDQFLQLDDALIKRVHYTAHIYRTDDTEKPACTFEAPPPQKCPATEYLQTNWKVGKEGVYTVQSTRDMKTGKSTQETKVGRQPKPPSWEGNMNMLIGSAQFNPTDGSYQMSMGIGLDSGELLPGPLKVSEKVELIYDSACGFGIKGTATAGSGLAEAGVEGAIFLTKGP
ncbi:MAG: hypothetical protein RLZZ200_267 [Pseudomonadota bacterium]|jgi:hypothetical protein